MGQRGKYSTIGSRIGIGSRGQMVKRKGASLVDLSRPAVDALVTISAEAATAANQRDISITLLDDEGDAINYAEQFEIVALLNSGGTDFAATGGSTGIAQGSGGNTGKMLAIVAKKLFRCITSTGGVFACIYTDTGTEAVYLGVRLPNGRVIVAGALTNA